MVRESEDRATEIRNWHPYLLPGLLQTPRYAEILIGHGSPGEKPETVAALAKARCERLGQLRAEFRAVISESALRSAVGSAAIMSEQLQHLLDVGDRARIQVLPSSCGFFGGLTGSFRLLSFADRTPRVECEHAGGSVLVSDAAEVRRLTSVFSELSGWAYDFRTSSELIREVMHGYAVEEE
ncbi:DUF5753 domain-containing protein [Streptomonospora nanhaiensis]|nr:DUF5753 domain-containing protein [Streptomonospora nanhaiensis]MBV2366274.1 DUF5753 domain-containing protein [Streptomonospora nanhaiensis]